MSRDRELADHLRAARGGDTEAFGELVKATYADTYTLAFRLMGNVDDANDVVQETYIRAFKALGRFRGDSRFTTWLYRITANRASTHLGRRKRLGHTLLDEDTQLVDETPEHDPEFTIDNGQLHVRLVEALERLSRPMRAVVVLRDVYDLTHEDIARELGISVTAAKVRLHRARRRLRELIGGDEAERRWGGRRAV